MEIMKTRRPDILKAAYDLMGIQGLESLHARTVAAELGINHATVHYYFPTRTDLLVGVAEYAHEQFQRDRAKLHEGARNNKEKLESELALAEAYCKKTSRFVKVLAGLYVASTSNMQVRRKLQEIWKEWVALVTTLLGSGKVKKSSPFDDAELLVCSLFGIAVASHMLDGKLNSTARIDEVYKSMFG